MSAAEPIIPDRAEFVDALNALRRGHPLIRVYDRPGGWLLDGCPVYWSFKTLLDYGLVDEYDNPDGFPAVQYYRLSQRGRSFAEKACSTWQRRPLLQRLAMRVTG